MTVIADSWQIVDGGAGAPVGWIAELHARLFDPAWSAAGIAALVEQPETITLVLATGDARDVGGFAIGRCAGGACDILTIAVARELQRHGYGARLLGALEQAARARGAEEMLLEVEHDNTPAQRLYQRAGYREVGRRRGYYRRVGQLAVDALVLKRELAA